MLFLFTALLAAASKYQSIIDAAISHSKQRKIKEETEIMKAGTYVSALCNYTLLYDIIPANSHPIAGFHKSKKILAIVQNENTNFKNSVFHNPSQNKTYYIKSCLETHESVNVYEIMKINPFDVYGYYHILSSPNKLHFSKSIEWEADENHNMLTGRPTKNLIPIIYEKLKEMIQKRNEMATEEKEEGGIKTKIKAKIKDQISNWLNSEDQEEKDGFELLQFNIGAYLEADLLYEVSGFGSIFDVSCKITCQAVSGFDFILGNTFTFPELILGNGITVFQLAIPLAITVINLKVDVDFSLGFEYIKVELPISYNYGYRYSFFWTKEFSITSKGYKSKNSDYKFSKNKIASEWPSISLRDILLKSKLEAPIICEVAVTPSIELPLVAESSIDFKILKAKFPVQLSFNQELCSFPYLYVTIAETPLFTAGVFNGITFPIIGTKFAKDLYNFNFYTVPSMEFCLVKASLNDEKDPTKIFTNDKISVQARLQVKTGYTSKPKIVSFSIKSNDNYIKSKVYSKNKYEIDFLELSGLIATDLDYGTVKFQMNAISDGNADYEFEEVIKTMGSYSGEIPVDQIMDGWVYKDDIHYKIIYKSGVRVELGKIYKIKSRDSFIIFNIASDDSYNNYEYLVWTKNNDKYTCDISKEMFFDTSSSSLTAISGFKLKPTNYKFLKANLQDYIQKKQFKSNVYIYFKQGNKVIDGIFIKIDDLQNSRHYNAEELNCQNLCGLIEFQSTSNFQIGSYFIPKKTIGNKIVETSSNVFDLPSYTDRSTSTTFHNEFYDFDIAHKKYNPSIIRNVDPSTEKSLIPTIIMRLSEKNYADSAPESQQYFTILVENPNSYVLIYIENGTPLVDSIQVATHTYLISKNKMQSIGNNEYIFLVRSRPAASHYIILVTKIFNYKSSQLYFNPRQLITLPESIIVDTYDEASSYYAIPVGNDGDQPKYTRIARIYDHLMFKFSSSDIYVIKNFIKFSDDEFSKYIDLKYNDVNSRDIPFKVYDNILLQTIETNEIKSYKFDSFPAEIQLRTGYSYNVFKKCSSGANINCILEQNLDFNGAIKFSYENDLGINVLSSKNTFSSAAKSELFTSQSYGNTLYYYKPWAGDISSDTIYYTTGSLKVSIVVKNDAILLIGKIGEHKLPVSLLFLYNHYQDIINTLLLEEINPGQIAIETESDKYPDAALIFPLSKYRISSISSARKIKSDFTFAELFGLPNEKVSEDPIEIENENPNVRYPPDSGDDGSGHDSGSGTGDDGSGHDSGSGTGDDGSGHDSGSGTGDDGSGQGSGTGTGYDGSGHDSGSGTGDDGSGHDSGSGTGDDGSGHDSGSGTGDDGSGQGSGTGTGYDGSGSDGEVSGSKIDESVIIQPPVEHSKNKGPFDSQPENGQGEGNSNSGKIAGIAIGCVIMIAVIVAIVIFVIIFIRKRSKESTNDIITDDAEAKSDNGAEDIEP